MNLQRAYEKIVKEEEAERFKRQRVEEGGSQVVGGQGGCNSLQEPNNPTPHNKKTEKPARTSKRNLKRNMKKKLGIEIEDEEEDGEDVYVNVIDIKKSDVIARIYPFKNMDSG